MTKLMQELERIRKANGWKDQQMADYLGISRSMYSQARSGKKQPGRVFLTKVKARYEWLDLNYYFASEAHYSDTSVTQNDNMAVPA
jgi:transcriptional regulator with XRE-family HTH domain